ncbi:MAG TPA: nicotinate phosphoribosyltransferase [Thermomicrobiaceae bacterium]|nr:nicotinate phosphoribosyltransferase [Thermomicrobiaceae bacterium]
MASEAPLPCRKPERDIALATDLYQLTMGAGYAALDLAGPATFSLFVRRLPADRSFLVVAGLSEALARLRGLRFEPEDLAYLRTLPQVRPDFIERLAGFRFHGDVWAVPEGRTVFADEPILEVQATILEAQLVETALVNALHFPITVATKAARCVIAAPGRSLVDFGLRRTPGIEAGLSVARSCYLAGFDATSNLMAGARYGIPVSGTVAHSFVEAFPTELDAFRAFATVYPGPVTLLIDTYDSLRGAEHAVVVARELAARGGRLAAVRIDSGDLAALSVGVRRILDAAGLDGVQIVASGGLDEFALAELAALGAPIDAYGVGTRVGTAADAPTLDMAYKLVDYDGVPRLKLSEGKRTLVGAKQVWRRRDAEGRFVGDVIAGRDDASPGPAWEPLLEPVMRAGTALPEPDLSAIRARHHAEVAALPAQLLRLRGTGAYPVTLSPDLARRQALAEAATRQREGC